ncbi:MAG: lytic transglycosylase domain-containing protein [Thermodesulfobacteriota bacterium]
MISNINYGIIRSDMQVNQVDISPGGMTGTGRGKTGAQKGLFEQSLEAARENRDKGAASGDGGKISLGRISSDQPTVSHLMVENPDYGGQSWDIIHSEQNHDKPYKHISEGTEIFLDPETRELSWQADHRVTHEGQKQNPASPDASMEEIERCISRAASENNLSEQLIKSVIRAESGFDTSAVSNAGARGLMQLMPETARELGVTDSFDIRENIEAGARYLKKMLNDFGGSLEKALAAYNAGPGAVERFSGEVPYTETRQYVERVLSFLQSGGK